MKKLAPISTNKKLDEKKKNQLIGTQQIARVRLQRLTPVILGDQENQASRPAWQIVQENPISKITRAKWTEGMAQVVEAYFAP
jgi:hypothetical protein